MLCDLRNVCCSSHICASFCEKTLEKHFPRATEVRYMKNFICLIFTSQSVRYAEFFLRVLFLRLFVRPGFERREVLVLVHLGDVEYRYRFHLPNCSLYSLHHTDFLVGAYKVGHPAVFGVTGSSGSTASEIIIAQKFTPQICTYAQRFYRRFYTRASYYKLCG